MNNFKINLILLIFFSTLFSQFGLVEVEMDLTQIRASEKQFLKSLPEDIKSYFENVVYNSDVEDLELELLIKIIPENVPRNGNERVVTTQILFTNYVDQTYFARSVKFSYSSGVNLSYSTDFQSLRSILDYYGLLFVGSEIDIWSQYGGEIYFMLSEEIANMGKDANLSDGWEGRKQYIEDVILFKEFRNSKFAFFKSLDEIYVEEGVYENQLNSLTHFYDISMDIPDYEMEFKYTRNFFKAYADEISKLFVTFKLFNELKEFQFLDPENKHIYNKYIVE
jgi:hypothetical protein